MREAILAFLEKNSRLSVKKLAVLLDLPEEKISNEMNAMEEEHIICGYNTLVNWNKVGREFVTALIEVKVTPQQGDGFDKIANRISKYDEVKGIYLMSGGYDFTVIVEAKEMKDVAAFVSGKLATLSNVLSTQTHFVLKKYKEHGSALEAAELEDERMIVSP